VPWQCGHRAAREHTRNRRDAGDPDPYGTLSMAGAVTSKRCHRYRRCSFCGAEGKVLSDKKRVLILCTGNSARSQMAEGLLRHDSGDRFEGESAGTKASSVRREAIAVMREVGIDISAHRSKNVDEFDGQGFDYLITVCDNAREACPVFFGKAQRLHRDFEDPARQQARRAKDLPSTGASGMSYVAFCGCSVPALHKGPAPGRVDPHPVRQGGVLADPGLSSGDRADPKGRYPD